MIALALVLAVALAPASPDATSPDAPSAETATLQADTAELDALQPMAADWLALIDAGDWGQSYSEADPAFRAALPLAQFAAAMEQSRTPLGALERREFLQFGSVSQGSGTYRIVQFRSNFANRRDVIETVTFSQSAGGYAVSGYWTTDPQQIEASGTDAQTETAARSWLALVDAGDWQGSFEAAGTSFQEPNTVATWRAASQQARVPLGALVSREAITFQDVASPEGYRVVQFRSDFESRGGVIESVTLEREDGEWRVVGYFIN